MSRDVKFSYVTILVHFSKNGYVAQLSCLDDESGVILDSNTVERLRLQLQISLNVTSVSISSLLFLIETQGQQPKMI